ncbi:MAG TPA: iron-sulfur cluster assembly scaffold protein [Pyrinomonadaceae bacterium]|jgi:NifU-like protein|nr:iron-sulfur cluster assembly scaffold protein [Pyrinomonadaceae bacterium]
MSLGPNLLSQLFLDPPHVGEAVAPNVVGRAGSFECGAVLRVSLHIDESQRIVDAKFKAAGCGTLITSTSLLIEQVIGKTTAEAAAVAQDLESLQEQLGSLPAEKSECVLLACEALISAIRNFSDTARDEWEGDEALICTCFCVSERTIEREIQAKRLHTISEVTAACSAGGGCRSCYPLIEDILETVNSES